MSDESGWLVELGSHQPQWWMGKSPSAFTYDASQAMRFARFEDAERARCYLVEQGWREGCRSLEHIWAAAPPAPQEPNQ